MFFLAVGWVFLWVIDWMIGWADLMIGWVFWVPGWVSGCLLRWLFGCFFG